jgi:deoxyribodipyrimidine photo-lyase
MIEVPEIRISAANDAPIREERPWVLYWMIASRRPSWNFALDRAVEHSKRLRKPLVVLEALRAGYPWASDRIHRFVLDGMAENHRLLGRAGFLHYPFVEPEEGGARGLLAALAERSAVVVVDDSPILFLPRMISAVAGRLDVRLERVDSCGLLPLAAAERTFETAHSFRRFLQKNLRPHLGIRPSPAPARPKGVPAADELPPEIRKRWPAASERLLSGEPGELARLPIDHSVGVVETRGGHSAARRALGRFLDDAIDRYADDRSSPDAEASSGLSPWLHFGQISPHEILDAVAKKLTWDPTKLSDRTSGSREGWWNLPRGAEAFLDQLVTWRELGFGFCSKRQDAGSFESLPAWARGTLEKHAGDRREWLYELDELERGATHDRIWNAAQTELLRTGRMQNYLRMLWGKKILEWSPTPLEAFERMYALNDRWALDGRDPNSCSGISWCFGRFDRPWGPERPIFGTVRYMSSENTARKLDLARYLERFGPGRR